jgi:hypothetical protein
MRGAYINKRRTQLSAPTGYVAITKPLAKQLYETGVEVTLCGNNVNSFNVLDGWHLGYSVCKPDIDSHSGYDWTFDSLCDNYLSYMHRELGSYIVFYVKWEDLSLC